MPDGNKNRGFKNKPVVLQLGTGLGTTFPGGTEIPGGIVEVLRPVVEYAMTKYGMRVWLKYNGWGEGFERSEIFQARYDETRVGYEPGGSMDTSVFPTPTDLEKALEDHSSYVCFQDAFLNDQTTIYRIQNDLAPKIGTQITIQSFNYPLNANSGQNIQLTFTFKNSGVVPLLRPHRVGIKDEVASYDIFVNLVSSSGQVVRHETFTPSTPTYQWNQDVTITETRTFTIPSVSSGQYTLKIGILDPDKNEGVKLVSTFSGNACSGYNAGTITIGS